METEALGLAQELDFSLALFWRATFTVKLVMIVLVDRLCLGLGHHRPEVPPNMPAPGRGGGFDRGVLVGRAARRALR
jgi:hypothetical protein